MLNLKGRYSGQKPIKLVTASINAIRMAISPRVPVTVSVKYNTNKTTESTSRTVRSIDPMLRFIANYLKFLLITRNDEFCFIFKFFSGYGLLMNGSVFVGNIRRREFS